LKFTFVLPRHFVGMPYFDHAARALRLYSRIHPGSGAMQPITTLHRLMAGAKPVAACVLAAAALLSASLSVNAQPRCGKASWYALTSRTASGEMADPSSLSAAHRSLPFGTMVQVRNLRNGKTVTVRVNDRGPFVKGRIIDVTRAAAAELGFLKRGITRVEIRTLDTAVGKVISSGAGCGK
jgi:rare lipoprotein A